MCTRNRDFRAEVECKGIEKEKRRWVEGGGLREEEEEEEEGRKVGKKAMDDDGNA